MAFHQGKTLKNWNNSKAEVRSRGEAYKKEKIQRSKAEIEENLQKKTIPKPKSKVRSRGEAYKRNLKSRPNVLD